MISVELVGVSGVGKSFLANKIAQNTQSYKIFKTRFLIFSIIPAAVISCMWLIPYLNRSGYSLRSLRQYKYFIKYISYILFIKFSKSASGYIFDQGPIYLLALLYSRNNLNLKSKEYILHLATSHFKLSSDNFKIICLKTPSRQLLLDKVHKRSKNNVLKIYEKSKVDDFFHRWTTSYDYVLSIDNIKQINTIELENDYKSSFALVNKSLNFIGVTTSDG